MSNYKIESNLNVDAVAKHATEHPTFLVKGKDDRNYGNFILWINDKIRYGYDCSLSIKKEKDSKEKTTYIGNGTTPEFLKKQKFESEASDARIKGVKMENPFKSSSISLSINLTAVKEYLKDHPTAKNAYGQIDIVIYVNDETNSFGNDVSIAIKKPEWSSEEIFYIGNGKTALAFKELMAGKKHEAIGQEKSETQTEEMPEVVDDLPF